MGLESQPCWLSVVSKRIGRGDEDKWEWVREARLSQLRTKRTKTQSLGSQHQANSKTRDSRSSVSFLGFPGFLNHLCYEANFDFAAYGSSYKLDLAGRSLAVLFATRSSPPAVRWLSNFVLFLLASSSRQVCFATSSSSPVDGRKKPPSALRHQASHG